MAGEYVAGGSAAIGMRAYRVFTYQPFQELGSLPAPGPIFVHAHACERYDGPLLPPDFQVLPLVVEGYRDGGRLVTQERVGDQNPEAVLARAFDEARADYAHIRNGEAGCFMARVERRGRAS